MVRATSEGDQCLNFLPKRPRLLQEPTVFGRTAADGFAVGYPGERSEIEATYATCMFLHDLCKKVIFLGEFNVIFLMLVEENTERPCKDLQDPTTKYMGSNSGLV